MTFPLTGSGTLRYRVVIDGCPYEPVTTQAMTRAASVTGSSPTAVYHAARVEGLKLEGVNFSIHADPVACKLDVGGIEIKLVDVDIKWSQVFDLEPSCTTWLTEDIDATQSSYIACLDNAQWDAVSVPALIWIDGEAILTNAIEGTDFGELSRGQLSPDADSAQHHYVTDGVRLRSPEITNWPVLWEGRRCYVYRYDESDDPLGDGHIVYRGTITTSPSFDGTTWRIGLDSIASALEQTFGADLAGGLHPRGIHYTTLGPFQMNVKQYPAAGGTNPLIVGVSLVGFYETQEEFCAALTAAILVAFTAASASGSMEAVSDGPDGWHLRYHTAVVSPMECQVQITTLFRGSTIAPLDPPLGAIPDLSQGTATPVASPVPTNQYGFPQLINGTPTGYGAGALASDTDYFFLRPMQFPTGPVVTSLGAVPRGAWDYNASADGRAIYLDGAQPIPSGVTSVLVTGTDASGDYEDTYEITATDAGLRSITVSPFTPVSRTFFNDALPEIRLGLTLQTLAAPAGVSIADVLDYVSANQQQYGTLGVMPFLRAGDYDSAAWHAIFDTLPPINSQRIFVTFSPVSLNDIVSEELKAAACFLSINSAGALVPKRLRLPAQSEVSAIATIDVSRLLTDKARVGHEVSGLGQVNQVTYQTGFTPSSSDFDGPTFTVRDVAAFGQSSSVRVMEIAQHSQYIGSASIDAAAALAAFSPIFGALAGSYSIDTIDAANSEAVEVGDAIKFDCPYLIEATTTSAAGFPEGQKGVLGRVGIVLGKEWGAYSPRVRFTVLNTKQKIAGYAPADVISSQVNTSGNTWTLTMAGAYYPPNSDASDFFAALDRVQALRFNTISPTVTLGTVVSVNVGAGTIVVTFDGVWTPGSFNYLTLSTADDVLASQLKYPFVADSVALIDPAGPNQQRAKVFAS